MLAGAVAALDDKYDVSGKISREGGLQDILAQLVGRLANSYMPFSRVRGKRILDIACGSNTSRAPSSVRVDTPFGQKFLRRAQTAGYTAQFEPWFCRILVELGAEPVGIDIGDLSGERFEHYNADLGEPGALDFLPSRSFDGVQDSRLFGSPEFTAQFPDPVVRRRVAQEIVRQEQRLLKPDGVIIHSDARALLE